MVDYQVPDHVPVTVNGVTLVVKTWQAAADLRPLVVLLPATGETAEDWDVVASALAGSRTVYAVNLRGHGPATGPAPTRSSCSPTMWAA